MKRAVWIFGMLTALFVLWAGWDYLPHKEPAARKAAEADVKAAKRRELEATAKLRAAEQELEHTHQLVVKTDAPLKRDSIAYEFGRRHLDTTSIDSVNAQLVRANNVIVDQQKKIAALEADTASKAAVIISQRALLKTKDDNYAALERLNKSIAAEIPTRRQQLVHDAKVVGYTLSAVGLAGAIAAIAR